MDVITEIFPDTELLLCTFHVIKAVKTRIAKLPIESARKTELLDLFRKILYFPINTESIMHENKFYENCHADLKHYYDKN